MNKKKMICTALCALTLAALTACGEPISAGSSAPAATQPAETTVSATAGQENQTPGEMSFVFKTDTGVEIPVKAESDPIVAALGAPKETFEAPSCAFEGKSYTYTYNGFTLETYPDGNVNRVYAVTLTDATQKTPEGLTVGSTDEAVKTACGAPEKEAPAYLRYVKDGIDVQFFREEGKITSIIYTFRVA